MGDATYTARLKTGAGQFKRLAESWARRVLCPTSQGFRTRLLLAPKLITASLITDYFFYREGALLERTAWPVGGRWPEG